MSLAKKLADIKPKRGNKGCTTCRYLAGMTTKDRQAFDEWIASNLSLTQLWEACLQDGLDISITGFRHHTQHHKPHVAT